MRIEGLRYYMDHPCRAKTAQGYLDYWSKRRDIGRGLWRMKYQTYRRMLQRELTKG